MDAKKWKNGVQVYACARKEIRKEGGSVWLAENRTTVGGKRYATAF